jgi:hypothetical protein
MKRNHFTSAYISLLMTEECRIDSKRENCQLLPPSRFSTASGLTASAVDHSVFFCLSINCFLRQKLSSLLSYECLQFFLSLFRAVHYQPEDCVLSQTYFSFVSTIFGLKFIHPMLCESNCHPISLHFMQNNSLFRNIGLISKVAPTPRRTSPVLNGTKSGSS